MIGSAIKDWDPIGRPNYPAMLSEPRGLQGRDEKPLALDLDIVVENHGRRSVHVDDKSASIERNRRQAHRIEQVGRGCDGPRALVTAAISSKRRVKEVRIRSSSASNWQASEFTPDMSLHPAGGNGGITTKKAFNC